MKTLQIPYAFLKACLRIAPKDDVRCYLNGVLVDVREHDARLVVTDGRRIGVFHLAPAEGDEYPRKSAQVIIPRKILQGLKAPRGIVAAVLQYDDENPAAECRIADRTFTPIDGKFPDYSRVLPNDKPSDELGAELSFNPAYVKDFADMRRDAMEGNQFDLVNIYPNGNGAAAVLLPGVPEFYGALMPMRGNRPEWELPQWLKGGGK